MGDTNIIKTKPHPDVQVDMDIVEDALTIVEKQVIVNCFFQPIYQDTLIRIWKSTYLRDKESSHISKLLTAFNITFYPVWTPIGAGKKAKFTLVFSALPSDCSEFDLFEDIPQGGGFYSEVIKRNKSDVYNIELDSNT